MFKIRLKNFLIFILLIPFTFTQIAFAQLSGNYTIPDSPFSTIKKAIDSLNVVGVGSGGVTFNVTAGYKIGRAHV